MGRHQRLVFTIDNFAGERARVGRARARAVALEIVSEPPLDLIPGGAIDDRLVECSVALPIVFNFTEVNGIGEQPVDLPARERRAAKLPATGTGAHWGVEVFARQGTDQQADIAQIEIAAIDLSDEIGFARIDVQRAAVGRIAQRRRTAHPHALGLRRSNLVAHALGDDLAFELGEAEQHIEGQPAHARGGVE